MPAGPLVVALAYEVAPKQLDKFVGGDVGADAAVQAQLDEAYDVGGLQGAPAMNLDVDPAPASRTSPVREALRDLAHGDAAARLAAAESLAARLGAAMDNRSKPCLFVASVHSTAAAARMRVVLWTFPRQQIFALTVGRGAARIRVEEAFVRESYLRKAASFEGDRGRTSFLQGRVLDKQALGTDRTAADLWIVKFLQGRLQMTPGQGTRELAKALRRGHDHLAADPAAQAEIHAAILAVRASQHPSVSLAEVADRYLSPVVAAVVRDAAPNDDALNARFELDRELFDDLIQFTIYQLDNGIWVSAPFDQVGQGLVLEGRHLTARGTIEKEQVRARRR